MIRDTAPLALLVASLLACGGSSKQSRTEPAGPQEASASPEKLDYYKNACLSEKNGEICYLIGTKYQRGETDAWGYAPQDFSEARRWHERGCSFGYPAACGELGVLHAEGKGGPVDLGQGLALLTQACDTDLTGVQAQLLCWKGGKAALKNDQRKLAFELYEKACARGLSEACDMVKLRDGTGRFQTGEPPSGALGYRFGMNEAEVRSHCVAGGHEFISAGQTFKNTRGDDFVYDLAHCSGGPKDLELDDQWTDVPFEFCDGKLCQILVWVFHAPPKSAEHWLTAFLDFRNKVARAQGKPGREHQSWDWCPPNDEQCLARENSKNRAHWTWEDKHSVFVQPIEVSQPNDVPMYIIQIAYLSPAGRDAMLGEGF